MQGKLEGLFRFSLSISLTFEVGLVHYLEGALGTVGGKVPSNFLPLNQTSPAS